MFAERSRIVNTIGLTGQSDAIINSAAVAQERSSTISKQMKVTVFLQNIIEAACGVKTPNLERDNQVILLLSCSTGSGRTRGKQLEVVREDFLEEVRFES